MSTKDYRLPYTIGESSVSATVVYDSRGKMVVTGYKEDKIKNMVACVNAMQGVNDPAALTHALREWRDVRRGAASPNTPCLPKMIDTEKALLDLIDQLKGTR